MYSGARVGAAVLLPPRISAGGSAEKHLVLLAAQFDEAGVGVGAGIGIGQQFALGDGRW